MEDTKRMDKRERTKRLERSVKEGKEELKHGSITRKGATIKRARGCETGSEAER
jgi:hypothetical protein